jgi:hypothetical protein
VRPYCFRIKHLYTVTFSTKNILLNQLNCHKSRLVHSSLELATLNNLFIYFVQETYNHKGNPCGLTKSYLHYLPHVDSRAAIYALPDLGLTFQSQLSSRNCTTCSFKVAWALTMDKASSPRRHHLAAVDSNAHSDAWGSTSTNPRGGRVEELLFQQGLYILNEGNSPTFKTAREATCIYITVATPALASLINNWKVQPEMHLSDHHLITATIQLTPDQMPLWHGRNLKKAD